MGAALRGSRHLPLRPARWVEIRSGAETSDPLGCTSALARAQAQFSDRWGLLLRHRRRRRPAHPDGRAHRGPLRGGGAYFDPGRGLLREGDRVTGVRIRDSRTARSPRCAASGDQRHRGVDRRVPGAVPAARPVPGAGVQGRAPRGAPRPDRQRDRHHPAHRDVGAVRDPLGHHWIIGTTDTDWNLDLAHPRPRPRPTSTTCWTTVNPMLVTPITHDDIEGVYAGLRPLLAGESEETSKLSREHAVAGARRA